ncbi:MAG TPA: hypothetical protein VMS86_10615 [Thermoanaerobaculia bacterium]|nr:hypothetical protein [Thermoanaerobaculia bacterium]
MLAGATVALREEVAYSPATWLGALFAAAPLLEPWAQAAQAVDFLLDRWFVMVTLVVIWRPLLGPFVAFMLYALFFIGRRPETAERLRRRLLTRIRAGGDVAPEMAAIAEIAEEGNVDPDHLDASLALWTAARYRGDPRLEAVARDQVRELLAIDAREWDGRFLAPLYRAWLIRAEAMLRSNPASARSVPPPLRAW